MDGRRVLEIVRLETPALVVLDVNMPGMSGFEVAEKLRQDGFLNPVLMITSYGDSENQVRGLAAGADDYLTKRVDLRVLVARVNALFRRGRAQAVPVGRVLRFGEVTVDLARREAQCDGKTVALTRTEFALLELLARDPGRPVTRAELLAGIWGLCGGRPYTDGRNARVATATV